MHYFSVAVFLLKLNSDREFIKTKLMLLRLEHRTEKMMAGYVTLKEPTSRQYCVNHF